MKDLILPNSVENKTLSPFWRKVAPQVTATLKPIKAMVEFIALNKEGSVEADGIMDVLATWQSPASTPPDWEAAQQQCQALVARGCLDFRVLQVYTIGQVSLQAQPTPQALGLLMTLSLEMFGDRWEQIHPKNRRGNFAAQYLIYLGRWLLQCTHLVPQDLVAKGEDAPGPMPQTLGWLEARCKSLDIDFPEELATASSMLDARVPRSQPDHAQGKDGDPSNQGTNAPATSNGRIPSHGQGARASASNNADAPGQSLAFHRSNFAGDSEGAERDRKRHLTDIGQFFWRQFPHCLESIVMQRLAVWHDIDVPPTADTEGKTMLAAPPADVRAGYAAATQSALNDVPSAWSALEKSLSAAPFWLEGQVLAIKMADRLENTVAGDVIAAFLADILARCPTLAELKFSDGTPFLSSEAAEDLLERQQSARQGADDDNQSDLKLPAGFENFLIDDQLGVLEAKAAKAKPGTRRHSLLILMLAEMYQTAGKGMVAHALAKNLLSSLDTEFLKAWEPKVFRRLNELCRDDRPKSQQKSQQKSKPKNTSPSQQQSNAPSQPASKSPDQPAPAAAVQPASKSPGPPTSTAKSAPQPTSEPPSQPTAN